MGYAVIKGLVAAAAAFGVAAFLFVSANPASAGLVAPHFNRAFHHHHNQHRNGYWPYGGVVETEPTVVVPALVGPAITQTPACTYSRDTVTVPSEDGGEKKITITRCY